MDIVEGIRKHGFRKWYERQLIEAHAWLVTGFLLLILSFALFEVRGETTLRVQRLLLLAGALGSFLGCLFTWWKYRRVLFDTEEAAELASCPNCRTFGKVALLRATPHSVEEIAARPILKDRLALSLRCRHCGHDWAIDPPRESV